MPLMSEKKKKHVYDFWTQRFFYEDVTPKIGRDPTWKPQAPPTKLHIVLGVLTDLRYSFGVKGSVGYKVIRVRMNLGGEPATKHRTLLAYKHSCTDKPTFRCRQWMGDGPGCVPVGRDVAERSSERAAKAGG